MAHDLRVFVLDDEPIVVETLALMLRANGFPVEGFTSPAAFLERPAYNDLACLLLDLRLGGESGLDVQDDLRRRGYSLPIVFLSGKGDVPSTARAMREGALDFLVKPVDEPQLLDALARARTKALAQQLEERTQREAVQRLAQLTKRERQVCDLIARGLLNKQIAYELGASENTVKVHRARVMHKLSVDSVAALVRLITDAEPRRPFA
jgi:FixJ family two-component response regulator